MSEHIKGTYLCLLDDVNLEDSLTLDEFDLRYLGVEEIISFLKGSDQHVSSEDGTRKIEYR